VSAHAQALKEYDGGAGGDVLAAYQAMARATARRAENRGLLRPEQLNEIDEALGADPKSPEGH
ncbi:MAG: oxidoreductase, partial [Paenarthrobacter sp.]